MKRERDSSNGWSSVMSASSEKRIDGHEESKRRHREVRCWHVFMSKFREERTRKGDEREHVSRDNKAREQHGACEKRLLQRTDDGVIYSGQAAGVGNPIRRHET